MADSSPWGTDADFSPWAAAIQGDSQPSTSPKAEEARSGARVSSPASNVSAGSPPASSTRASTRSPAEAPTVQKKEEASPWGASPWGEEPPEAATAGEPAPEVKQAPTDLFAITREAAAKKEAAAAALTEAEVRGAAPAAARTDELKQNAVRAAAAAEAAAPDQFATLADAVVAALDEVKGELAEEAGPDPEASPPAAPSGAEPPAEGQPSEGDDAQLSLEAAVAEALQEAAASSAATPAPGVEAPAKAVFDPPARDLMQRPASREDSQPQPTEAELDRGLLAEMVDGVLRDIDLKRDSEKVTVSGGRNEDDLNSSLNGYHILRHVSVERKAALVQLATKELCLNRAMGSMCGMGVGDALGHPFEFMPAQDRVRSGSPHFDLDTMKFHREKNTFGLQRGQWTDDAAMGLCMADSFICRRGFDGGDMRLRFWCWWNRGYNNAFRKDKTRSLSVGLGGNIRKSLNAITHLKKGERIPEAYEAATEDAGNGSLMRFTPVAVFLHASDWPTVHEIARASSYTTHPGIIAAEACSFLAHLLVSAIRLPAGQPSNVQDWLERTTVEYLQISRLPEKFGRGYDELKWLVTSAPVAMTERCWDWKCENLDVEGTLRARGANYNGYPVSSGYFGAYSLDGLAMALWSVYHTTSFDEAVSRSVNLLGDADSHGSITGQLAGALYGYDSINPRFLRWLNKWDDHEFATRAVLLHQLGTQVARTGPL